MKCEAFRGLFKCVRDATAEVDGVQLCGPHAAGWRRSRKAQAAWYQIYEAGQRRATAAYEQAERLSVALGVKVSPFGGSDYESMVVPAEFLEALVKERIDEDS